MAVRLARNTIRDVESLFAGGVLGDLSDSELLDRFVTSPGDSGEAAFAVLMRRHGPMVFGVCQRVLSSRHDAEDAFQTTFLVLARKAGRIGSRERLANWLYGVALRTAKDARRRLNRGRAREQRVANLRLVVETSEPVTDDLRRVLDEELARLPARFRSPLLLCELQSLSRQEAARSLGIPEGTLSSRLSRAKDLLRKRLDRRGVALSTGVLFSVVTAEARASAIPQWLFESTTRAAALLAAGESGTGLVSATVLTLTDEVMRIMLFSKLRGILYGVVSIGVAATGAVVLAQASGSADKAPTRDPVAATATTIGNGSFQGAGAAYNVGSESHSDADRLRGVEQKLDRILEALGSARRDPFSTAGSGGNIPVSDDVKSKSIGTVTSDRPYSVSRDNRPNPFGIASSGGDTIRSSTSGGGDVVAGGLSKTGVASRIMIVERRLEEIEHRLQTIESALTKVKQDEPVRGVQ